VIKVSACSYLSKKGDIHHIREVVFIEGQGVNRDLEVDGKDEDAFHVIAEDAGVAIGTARIERSGKVGRVSVLLEYRNRGIGRMLMKEIEAIAFRNQITDIHLHSQISAVKFYRNLGYQINGDEFMEAGIVHLPMCKKWL
jgi:predicted GNAT family N-acyltransferase